MCKNPTLQVNTLSRGQKLEMAMEKIRHTHEFGNKPWVKLNKNLNNKFDRNKANVLIKLCLSKKKSATQTNETIKRRTIDSINYTKQLEEIEILIDIIKKTRNACDYENHKPLVHVPLPREFYELRPLVSFKTAGKKSKKSSSRTLNGVTHDSDSENIFKDAPKAKDSDIPQRLHRGPTSIKKVDGQVYENVVVRKQEKPRVDKSTLTSCRVSPGYDKSTSTAETARSNTARSTSLRIAENDEPTLKSDLKTSDTALSTKKTIQKMQEIEQPSERGILREMSTISSNPYDSRLVTYPSFESITFIENNPNVIDANNLFLMENSWTIIDPIVDPLRNAKQVKINHSSKKRNENTTGKQTTREIEGAVLNDESNTESKGRGYVDETLKSPDRSKDESETKSHDCSEYENNKPDESNGSNEKKVTYLDAIPELNLTNAKLYSERQLEELGLFNIDRHNVDLELQEEFNKMESELFSVVDSKDSTLEREAENPNEHQSKPEENPEGAAESGVPSAEQQKVVQTKRDKTKSRRSKSRKSSKKRLPDVQLSDYKGFYVVHTTNDWSLS